MEDPLLLALQLDRHLQTLVEQLLGGAEKCSEHVDRCQELPLAVALLPLLQEVLR